MTHTLPSPNDSAINLTALKAKMSMAKYSIRAHWSPLAQMKNAYPVHEHSLFAETKRREHIQRDIRYILPKADEAKAKEKPK